MTIGKRLKRLREEKDLYQEDVAKIIGVAQNSYNNYEKENRTMPDEAKIKLCKFYGVSLDYLMGLTDNRVGNATIIPIKEALDDSDFIKWVKVKLLAAQDLAEKKYGEPAKKSRSQYESFEYLSKEKQFEILSKACTEVVRTDKGTYKLITD